MNELVEAADDKQLSKTIARYGRVISCVWTSLAHGTRPPRRGTAVPGSDQAEERSAIAIASNEPFSGWTKTSTDPRLSAVLLGSLVDPLVSCVELCATRRSLSGLCR